MMDLEYDETKRQRVLQERGLDFADANIVFNGPLITIDDDRKDYNEQRKITFGRLVDRLVVIVWTERGGKRRITSFRKANDREQKEFGPRLG